MSSSSAPRRRVLATFGAAAAIAGVGAATAMAAGSHAQSATSPVVTAVAITGSSSADTLAIAAAPGGAQAEWVIDTPSAGDPTLLSEPVSGGTPTAVTGADLGTAGFQDSQGAGAGVLINDGSYDVASNLDNALYTLDAAGTASTSTSNEAGATVTLGPDGNLYGGQDGTYLDETTLSSGVAGVTSTHQVPSFPPGGRRDRRAGQW